MNNDGQGDLHLGHFCCTRILLLSIYKYYIVKLGGVIMSDLKRLFIIGAILLYIVSPVDLMPGPLDDIIVTLIGIAARKKILGRPN